MPPSIINCHVLKKCNARLIRSRYGDTRESKLHVEIISDFGSPFVSMLPYTKSTHFTPNKKIVIETIIDTPKISTLSVKKNAEEPNITIL